MNRELEELDRSMRLQFVEQAKAQIKKFQDNDWLPDKPNNDLAQKIKAWFELLPDHNKTYQQIVEQFKNYKESEISASVDHLVIERTLIKGKSQEYTAYKLRQAPSQELPDLNTPRLDEAPVSATQKPRKAYGKIRFNKRSWSLRELCDSKYNKSGIQFSGLRKRMNKGWSIIDALTVPLGSTPDEDLP